VAGLPAGPVTRPDTEAPALNRTTTGKIVTAVIHNAEMSASMGVKINRVYALAFAFGVMLAALAGGLVEQGDLQAAEGLYQEALAHNDRIGSREENAAIAHLRYGVLLARLEKTDEARTHFEEALAMVTESGAPSERLLSLVHLALLDGGDPAEAVEALREDAKRMEHTSRMEASFLLYKATGDTQYLEAAHDLFIFWVEHAPEQYRETTLTNVRLHRDIMKAWEEHGKERA